MAEGKRIGVALTGSFCSFAAVFPQIERLCARNAVTAILSDAVQQWDTRFFTADEVRARVEHMTGRAAMTSVTEAEQIGPKKLFDVLLIAPCTGNTMAKLVHNIIDTPVLMAAKAHVRNGRPLVIAPATNDALAAAAANIGTLLGRRDCWFVPFYQDDPVRKPRSMIARFDLIEQAVDAALEGRQLQPIIAAPPEP